MLFNRNLPTRRQKTSLRAVPLKNAQGGGDRLPKIPLAYSKASVFRNTKGHTSNLWGKCPLYGGNTTGRLISWEIHYRPFMHLAFRSKSLMKLSGRQDFFITSVLYMLGKPVRGQPLITWGGHGPFFLNFL